MRAVALEQYGGPEALALREVPDPKTGPDTVLVRTAAASINPVDYKIMQGFLDGFVKLFCRPATGIVLGGVIVAPRASELILGLSMAVQQHLTVDQVAHTFAVYPSVSGSLTEAARRLMQESAY